jgi:hypothetical protein
MVEGVQIAGMALLGVVKAGVVTIDQFGAIANNDSLAAVQANAQAISLALASQRRGGTVVVPANGTYYAFPSSVTNATNLVFQLDGELIMPEAYWQQWPQTLPGSYDNFLNFFDVTNLTIRGSGRIDGQGWWWWVMNVLLIETANRPIMLNVQFCENVTLTGLTLIDAPYYHVWMSTVRNVEIYNASVLVNITQQIDAVELGQPGAGALLRASQAILEGRGHAAAVEHLRAVLPYDDMRQALAEGRDPLHLTDNITLPFFPLNTDGFDVAGQNVYIHDVFVRNFDDAVAVKPGTDMDGWCSENYLIERVTVQAGVGLTVGSVPSNTGVNCVRNVTFRDSYSEAPIKFLYVKSNPPDDPNNPGTAIIDGVTYQNIISNTSIRDSIYLGPQQQSQPGTGGPGWWPATNPDVTIQNVAYRNITAVDGLWFWPGVFRRNETNPSVNISLTDVHVSVWNATANYICNWTTGPVIDSSPVPPCFNLSSLL